MLFKTYDVLTDMSAYKRFKRNLIVVIAVFSALIFGFSYFTLYKIHSSNLTIAEERIKSTNHIYSENLKTLLSSLDSLLVAITDRVIMTGDSGSSIPSFLITAKQPYSMVRVLFITNSDGIITLHSSGREKCSGIDVSDRPYFTVHRDNPDYGLFLSPPVKNRVNNEWVMLLSRAIYDNSGEFKGVAVASIEPRYFKQLTGPSVEDEDITSGGLIQEIDITLEDGTILSHSPYNESLIGTNYTQHMPFYNVLKSEDDALFFLHHRPTRKGTILSKMSLAPEYGIHVYISGWPVSLISTFYHTVFFWSASIVIFFFVLIILAAINIKKSKKFIEQSIDLQSEVKLRLSVERELRESNAILQAAMDQSQAGIAIADAPDGRLRYVNNSGFDIMADSGLTSKTEVDFNSYISRWQMQHFDGTPYHEDEIPLARAIKYGEISSQEFVIRTDKSGKRIIMANAAPIFNEKKEVIAAVVVFLDITEQKMYEKSMEKSSIILEKTSDSVVMTDPTGIITYWNRGAEGIYGYKREEVLGRNISMLYKKENLHVLGSLIDDLLSGREMSDVEVACINKEKREVNTLISLTTVCDDSGKVVELVGITKDITERKQSVLQIEKSLKEKEVLLRELSHRTKNNMQIIRSLLVLQASVNPTKEVKKVVSETENRIQAMALVHQKLYKSDDLSKISLDEYIGELTELLIKGFSISKDKIVFLYTMERVEILLDTAMPLGLILNELITNSLKHAFPGDTSGAISIKLYRSPSGTIELDFSDNGVGVPEDFSFYEQKTLGIETIIEVATYQLKAELKFMSENGVGIHLSFKDDLYDPRV